ISAVLLVSPTIRLYFRKLLEKDLPSVPVLSYSEIAENVKINSLEMIKLTKTGSLAESGIKE
ncbi:MAG: hypothetical protein ACD_79C00876G0001, partial [uncultured bacterium]